MSQIARPRHNHRAAARAGERGFALLEIMVAFIVLALGMGAISAGIVVAIRSDGRSEARGAALRLAQSRLEAAGIAAALVAGHRQGRIGNRFQWQETISPVQIGAPPQQRGDKAAAPEAGGPRAFWVEVAVEAADGTVATVSGLKLALESKP